MGTSRVQTSLRLPGPLFEKLRQRLGERHQSMNPVIEALVQAWLDDEHLLSRSAPHTLERAPDPFEGAPESWSHFEMLKAFMRWIPAALCVKEWHGRLLCLNETFRQLIGQGDLIGLLATDYFESDQASAAVVMRHDQLVRDEGKPFVFAEHLVVRGVSRRRITLRFPIRFESEGPFLTGVLGFDVADVLEKVQTLPSSGQGLRACKLPIDRTPTIEVSDAFNSKSLLRAFIDALPAIATVKACSGRLLCHNSEYVRVTGKRDALGKLASENWNAQTAQWIMVHDQFVRETEAPFLSVDTIEIPNPPGTTDRLNIRFPIFNSNRVLVLTGSFGFEHQSILRALQLFENLPPPPSGDFLR